MRAEFLRDYRGRLTGERFYQAGSVVDFDGNIVAQLEERGVVVALDAPEPTPKTVRTKRSRKDS